jgi:hypothetical protein
MADSKAVIKSVDMSEEMQQEAIEVSTQALEKYNIEKDIAAHIKREFDKKYGKFDCRQSVLMMVSSRKTFYTWKIFFSALDLESTHIFPLLL